MYVCSFQQLLVGPVYVNIYICIHINGYVYVCIYIYVYINIASSNFWLALYMCKIVYIYI